MPSSTPSFNFLPWLVSEIWRVITHQLIVRFQRNFVRGSRIACRQRPHDKNANFENPTWRTAAIFKIVKSPYLSEQELSYCKQIARQLRTQYVDGINSNLVTLKSRLRVTQGHPNWYHSKALVRYSIRSLYDSYGCIFSRLWDIQRQRMARPWKLG